jgi:septum formation protein
MTAPSPTMPSSNFHETPSDKRRLRYPIVLASGSPRRKELMASLGLDYEIVVSDVDEGAFNLDHLKPEEVVKFLARTKAQEVFKHRSDAYVVGADTIVVLDGQVFGKPVDEADACRMLTALQGRAHEVYSGICIFNPDQSPNATPLAMDARRTQVFMRAMSPDEVRGYVATREPMDKAGAYAIQGYGAALIERVDGCYFNVVGLSLNQLDTLFGQFGEKLVL